MLKYPHKLKLEINQSKCLSYKLNLKLKFLRTKYNMFTKKTKE